MMDTDTHAALTRIREAVSAINVVLKTVSADEAEEVMHRLNEQFYGPEVRPPRPTENEPEGAS